MVALRAEKNPRNAVHAVLLKTGASTESRPIDAAARCEDQFSRQLTPGTARLSPLRDSTAVAAGRSPL
jgi:hypothetical protein